MKYKEAKVWEDEKFIGVYKLDYTIMRKSKGNSPLERMLEKTVKAINKEFKRNTKLSISDLYVTQETYRVIEKELHLYFKRVHKMSAGTRRDMQVGLALLDLGPAVFYGTPPDWAILNSIYLRS